MEEVLIIASPDSSLHRSLNRTDGESRIGMNRLPLAVPVTYVKRQAIHMPSLSKEVLREPHTIKSRILAVPIGLLQPACHLGVFVSVLPIVFLVLSRL